MPAKTTKELKTGDKAPAFDCLDETGARRQLKDFKGKTVVLYFYPKDDTPGCTIEACEFRDSLAKFKTKKTVILGVSPDDAASHAKFIQKFGLTFPLLADVDRKVCEAYGVWKKKSFMGREYMGVERSTFVIGPDGKLVHVERGVTAKGHAAAMLDVVK
ncbi:MAG: thioredoxin-dependent thiol peroxidase [Elusimicrobia bacterium]|nr:thioredoxin-dependent thiol peroxidase [Elusimicrobiota bacterium]